MKALTKIFAASAIAFASMGANAELIAVDDWHLTSDEYSGLKMSNFSDEIFYAASLTGLFNTANTYEMLDGYRWASESDYAIAYDSRDMVNGDFLSDNTAHNYYNQGGWNSYTFNGIARYILTFNDTALTGRSTHVGGYEGSISAWALPYTESNATISEWAGFVLVKDDSLQSNQLKSVPLPATSILLGLGLVAFGARRKKVSANL